MSSAKEKAPYIISFLLILMSAIGVFPLDVILPSVPAISSNFGIAPSHTAAGIAAFIIGVAISQLFIGPISDKVGRKTLFISCVFFAAAASLACTFSRNAVEFYFFRTLQAFGCGGFVLVQAFVQDVFSGKKRITQRILMTTLVACVFPSHHW